MKIIDKDGELLMRDFPTTNWAYGTLLLLGSLVFSAGLFISLKKSSFQVSHSIVLAFIFFALYFAYRKFSSPIIISRLRPNEKIIEITNIKFGLIKKMQTFRFSQIERFEIIERKRERAFLYFNSMLLLDGTYIDLESEGHSANNISIIPERLNEILKKHQERHKPATKSGRKMKAVKK